MTEQILPDKVYVVQYGSYSDVDIDSIWVSKEKAEKYCEEKNIELKEKLYQQYGDKVSDYDVLGKRLDWEVTYNFDRFEFEEYDLRH